MALVAETAPGVVVGGQLSIRGGVACCHRWRSCRRRHHGAFGRPWNRHRPFVYFPMDVIKSISNDVHAAGGGVAHYRAVAVIRLGRLPGW